MQSYDCLNEQEIHEKINIGHEAYLAWKQTSFSKRKSLMLQLAQLLKEKTDELAQLMAVEMGKPITAGKAEINKCAWLCEHYAEHAEEYLAPILIQTEMKKAKVCHQPLGIVFAIMPWNFPFWQVFRFAVPSLMAGNTAVLKHAPVSTGTGNKIEQLFLDVGFPVNVFQHLIVDNDGAAKMIEHPYVIAVTLTGSGRARKRCCWACRKIFKKISVRAWWK